MYEKKSKFVFFSKTILFCIPWFVYFLQFVIYFWGKLGADHGDRDELLKELENLRGQQEATADELNSLQKEAEKVRTLFQKINACHSGNFPFPRGAIFFFIWR